MTITDLLPSRDNKHYFHCYHCEKDLNELKDQLTCLQRSVANLRKDLPALIIDVTQKRKGKIRTSRLVNTDFDLNDF